MTKRRILMLNIIGWIFGIIWIAVLIMGLFIDDLASNMPWLGAHLISGVIVIIICAIKYREALSFGGN
ncbi:MAG: hypothetical protein UW46_C0005G0002 [Candidatus Yanofskybacteria bacterium GW2011_GWF1_44_227]|uniref:Uncharacterized protein n=1 Tax=Candidatus Yanofskybacteria bacterium GW2011_GWE2_40_11 TaxID=1619033 RepID=A0A0G0T1I9_9BACT|nr:MAG: hypothetical protein UT75_C0002G0002 [Candidatus Yanofskybacteria bacterium GW2011_GWE2_40_11]KKT15555.1 MAG: hypothetical protein UV97_C0005G0048 [Candidatus Yanofskybacteria bacterium GW2011_GWF2_43_596]KKT53196.1 MAG: hypothetical protein UW46_C0005G0002 [Candidatus Yanofskybacteria bacterium GW2011_GWF1_44_227]OGN35593.1 MAG: hypothetical protein A2207_02540 [Candidatus Yanofskybacteria bacterium RIFOXYA1_FULL_44_17]OGN36702.1 MAG: hypothetical protein A2241_02840 [Candidatus Yanofs